MGDVDATGAFALMNPEVTVELKGRVYSDGTLRAYLNTFDGCGYDLIFRRRISP